MHTLLPYDDLRLSALALNDSLLGQQIEDCIDILETIHETERAKDYNHPTVQAWRGSELQLCEFGLECSELWLKRNGDNPWWRNATARLQWHLELAGDGDLNKPDWFGDERVHLEYQGLLRHLDPELYEKRWPNVATCTPENFRYPLQIIA